MYPTSGAAIRADLNIKVEEAAQADKFFIADLVMPPLPVDAKSGTYPKLQVAAAELLSAGSTVRSTDGSYGEVTRQYTSDTYDCIDRGLESRVDDAQQKDLARFFNLEVAEARWTMRNVKLDRELRVKTAIFNTGTFTDATDSTVAYTEANIATINAPADILAAIERVEDKGELANTMVIPESVFNRLKRSTLLQSFIRGTLTGELQTPINSASLAKAFADHGIEQCLIGRSRYNSAKKGQAASITKVWPVTYIWVGHVNPAATTPEDGGAGFTLVWNAEGGLYVTETYRDDKRRSNMVRVRQHTTEKITNANAGTLITTQYS
jgi:hypothetical protein